MRSILIFIEPLSLSCCCCCSNTITVNVSNLIVSNSHSLTTRLICHWQYWFLFYGGYRLFDFILFLFFYVVLWPGSCLYLQFSFIIKLLFDSVVFAFNGKCCNLIYFLFCFSIKYLQGKSPTKVLPCFSLNTRKTLFETHFFLCIESNKFSVI